MIKTDNIKLNNLKNHILYTIGKAYFMTEKLELIVKEDYFTFTMGYEYREERNEELINYYHHQIYVDIFGDYAEQVESFIAYSMTGVVKYRTNFLFNLSNKAANGKSTITNMYKAVLPLYLSQINKNTFSIKNKANQNNISKF